MWDLCGSHAPLAAAVGAVHARNVDYPGSVTVDAEIRVGSSPGPCSPHAAGHSGPQQHAACNSAARTLTWRDPKRGIDKEMRRWHQRFDARHRVRAAVEQCGVAGGDGEV